MVTKKVSKKKTVSSEIPYGLIAYIIGIIAIVEAFISTLAGIILAIIGLSFSKKQNDLLSKKANKLNMIALIIGLVILVIMIIAAIFYPEITGGLGY